MSDDIRIQIETRAGHKFAMLASGMSVEAHQAQQGLADDAELMLQAVAMKGVSTRLARGIKSVITSPTTIEVQSSAANPQSGFRYTGVTRFGHKKMFIQPRKRNRASVISTRNARGRGKRAALRIEFPNGEVIFRSKVKAFQPDHDWVDDAIPEIKITAKNAAITLGRHLITRFF